MSRNAAGTAGIRRRWSWKLGVIAERAMVLFGGSVALVVDHGLPVGVLTEDSLVAYAATLKASV